jgi:hypothetical protein
MVIMDGVACSNERGTDPEARNSALQNLTSDPIPPSDLSAESH